MTETLCRCGSGVPRSQCPNVYGRDQHFHAWGCQNTAECPPECAQPPRCVGVAFPLHRVDDGQVCVDCGKHVPTLALNSGAGQAMMHVRRS